MTRRAAVIPFRGGSRDIRRCSRFENSSTLETERLTVRYRSFSPFRAAAGFEFLFLVRVGNPTRPEFFFCADGNSWNLRVSATGMLVCPKGDHWLVLWRKHSRWQAFEEVQTMLHPTARDNSSMAQARLSTDLAHLGVECGDTLFIHASFKSIGVATDGACAVIAALEQAVGDSGLLLMPSFNLVDDADGGRASSWDISSTPSTVGWLTEFFRRMPGTVRSDHYSHSVAARGRDAAWIVGDHLAQTGLVSPWDRQPWGRTYGDQSPMFRAYDRARSKLLMLGVDYASSTYQHLVEVMYWNEQLADNPEAPYYYWKPRQKLGEFWESRGRFRRGNVGEADCRLFSIKDYVDTLLDEVRRRRPV